MLDGYHECALIILGIHLVFSSHPHIQAGCNGIRIFGSSEVFVRVYEYTNQLNQKLRLLRPCLFRIIIHLDYIKHRKYFKQ